VHPEFNHSFSNTNYSLSATIAARLLKNVKPTTISWVKYSNVLEQIKDYQKSLCLRVHNDVRDAGLEYYWRPVTYKGVESLTHEDVTGTYVINISEHFKQWYDHLDSAKKKEACKALAYLKKKNILCECLDIKGFKLVSSAMRLVCKSFVKVEIAIRHVSKPVRPRMIQFLPPEFMVNLAPHAYLCYKHLKQHTSDPQHLYVNTSGSTYETLSRMVQEALIKTQNASGLNLVNLATLFFNGDDSLVLMNKKLFLSNPWVDGSSIWGRDPVTHRKTSIYLATYCSGWFVRYFDGRKHVPFFEPRPFKALAKSAFVIATNAINVALKDELRLSLLSELIEARSLSMYYSFHLDPFMAEIALAWLAKVESKWYGMLSRHRSGSQTIDDVAPLTKIDSYLSGLTYQDRVRLNLRSEYKHVSNTLNHVYNDESVWWSYEVNYGVTKTELIALRDRLIAAISKCDIGSYELVDDNLLKSLIQADLDAKNPCVTQKDMWFDNEGDIGIYEVDCSAYDSTTQYESLCHNVWFQQECFGETLFIDAIKLRHRMQVQSRSRYQNAAWITRDQMLSGYYDTSIGNGITNCTEITTSLCLSYPNCYLKFE